MISAGTELIFDVPATLGFEQLTYSGVFNHLEENHGERVTIGSVHERIWASQRDFQLEVLATALAQYTDEMLLNVGKRARDLVSNADITSQAGRRYTAQNIVRNSSQAFWPEPLTNNLWLAHTVRFRLWSLGPGHPESEEFTKTLTEMRQTSMRVYVDIIKAAMTALRLRVRAEAGDPARAIDTLAVLGNSVIVGSQTDVLPQAHEPQMLPTGMNGELEQWHPDAVAQWALARHMLELDGDDLSDEERRL